MSSSGSSGTATASEVNVSDVAAEANRAKLAAVGIRSARVQEGLLEALQPEAVEDIIRIREKMDKLEATIREVIKEDEDDRPLADNKKAVKVVKEVVGAGGENAKKAAGTTTITARMPSARLSTAASPLSLSSSELGKK